MPPAIPIDLLDFLQCVTLLEAHGAMPAPGGWIDQSAWFADASSIYQGEFARLRRESDAFDAGFRQQQLRSKSHR